MREIPNWPGVTAMRRAASRRTRAVGSIGLILMFLALCGRSLDYPLKRDENLFITSSVLGGFSNLYAELGYNHLPYLPWLLGTVYRLTGTDHYLLVGRLVMLIGWAALVLALFLIARRQHAGFAAFCACAVLLLGNTLLLGQPGMLVSNNLLPLPAVMFSLYALLKGIDAERPSTLSCLISGFLVSIAVGLKANYIFVAPVIALATVLAPAGRPLATRIWQQSLPLIAGGVLGGLPILVLMVSAPEPFFAHTLRYFTQLQVAYWSHAPEPAVMSPAHKALLAEEIWGAGTSMLALAGVAMLLALLTVRGGWRETGRVLRAWPMLLIGALIACGIIVSFVPKPSFPQYFVPPVSFVVVSLLLLRGAISRSDARVADGLLISLAVLGAINSAPRLVPGLLDLVRPLQWQSMQIHSEMHALAQSAGIEAGETAVTMTPALALEAGFAVAPEFSAGQFVYRVADYIPARDRPWYTTTSPRHLEKFLKQRRPAAIIVSGEEELERPLETFARSNGYREFSIASRSGGPKLFRRP